jgi:hypothetical protein
MGQEFIIKSQQIEDKINQLLPSQGGFQPGVDFSASTQIIPIVDLTETAEGSALRQDLQISLSFNSATTFNVNNANTTVITTTGYYRITGGAVLDGTGTPTQHCQIIINDGLADKVIWSLEEPLSVSGVQNYSENVDYTVFLTAGDSLKIKATSNARLRGSVRQIADLQGNLVNPT